MSAPWDPEALLAPISAEHPCGESLEDTDVLASFDAFRLFGESRPLDAPLEPGEKREPKPLEAPVWPQIRDRSVEVLGKSRDLRVLAFLGASLLRTDGVDAFAGTLDVAAGWLESYWSQVHPLIDEDAVLRRNALNNFADSMAIVDGLRRVPLVRSRQHGVVCLRDLDGSTRPAAGDGSDAAATDEARMRAAFASMPVADLSRLHDRVVGAGKALQRIDGKMRDAAGTEATPNTEPLTALLGRLAQLLRAQLAAHPDAAGLAVGDAGSEGSMGPAIGGVIQSRHDAIRALDAISDFFRRTEPSSPIPLFLSRAKRLVAKDFLEVLADIAPDAVPQARSAGGLKSE